MNPLQTGQGGDTAMAVVILRRKRENEAVVVQAQISDAVLRDPTLFSLPITPTAHIPLWNGSPITVEVAGQVPSDDLREAARGLTTLLGTTAHPMGDPFELY